jgi:hypothetical protein
MNRKPWVTPSTPFNIVLFDFRVALIFFQFNSIPLQRITGTSVSLVTRERLQRLQSVEHGCRICATLRGVSDSFKFITN